MVRICASIPTSWNIGSASSSMSMKVDRDWSISKISDSRLPSSSRTPSPSLSGSSASSIALALSGSYSVHCVASRALYSGSPSMIDGCAGAPWPTNTASISAWRSTAIDSAWRNSMVLNSRFFAASVWFRFNWNTITFAAVSFSV